MHQKDYCTGISKLDYIADLVSLRSCRRIISYAATYNRSDIAYFTAAISQVADNTLDKKTIEFYNNAVNRL